MEILLPCLYCAIGSIGFAISNNIHGKKLILIGIGGSLSWAAFLLSAPMGSVIARYFLAAMVGSLYSEIMARVCKTPVTIYLIIALFPLVPGKGIYNTMEYAINGQTGPFLTSFLDTMGAAGALALGVLLISSAVKFVFTIKTFVQRKQLKKSENG